jgi:hypothetical protein
MIQSYIALASSLYRHEEERRFYAACAKHPEIAPKLIADRKAEQIEHERQRHEDARNARMVEATREVARSIRMLRYD